MRKSYIILAVAVSFFIAAIMLVFILKKNDYRRFSEECDSIIIDTLAKNKIRGDSLVRFTKQEKNAFRAKYLLIGKEFLLTPEFNLQEIKKSLLESKDFKNFSLGRIRSKKDAQGQTLFLDFYYKKLKVYCLTIKKKNPAGKLAIVLDDWGYNIDVFEESLKLGIPVTYAILPNLPYSSEIASKLHKFGIEFILHLPLEPHSADNNRLEQNTILTAMPKQEISKILHDDFAAIPHLKGVNNHMGSKATENMQVMNIIFAQMKQRNLYFLDSLVSEQSVCEKAAKANNLPFIRRNVFIDNENNKTEIKKKLLEAKKIAKKQGSCIAIGHARPLTIAALKETALNFRREGIIFVFASNLLEDMPIPAKNNGE